MTKLAIPSDFPVLKNWTLKVIFPKSRSSNYKNAVRLARLIDSYSEFVEEDGTLCHVVEFKPRELCKFKIMRGIIKNWKGSLFFINEDLVDVDDLKFIDCYRGKLIARHNKTYCQVECYKDDKKITPFMCKHILWPYTKNWYDYGMVKEDEVFYLDKEEIAETIIDCYRDYRYCPGLDLKEMSERLNKLPDTIDPRIDKKWEYKKKYSGDVQIYGVERKVPYTNHFSLYQRID